MHCCIFDAVSERFNPYNLYVFVKELNTPKFNFYHYLYLVVLYYVCLAVLVLLCNKKELINLLYCTKYLNIELIHKYLLFNLIYYT